jgi:hypothetical protein
LKEAAAAAADDDDDDDVSSFLSLDNEKTQASEVQRCKYINFKPY